MQLQVKSLAWNLGLGIGYVREVIGHLFPLSGNLMGLKKYPGETWYPKELICYCTSYNAEMGLKIMVQSILL